MNKNNPQDIKPPKSPPSTIASQYVVYFEKDKYNINKLVITRPIELINMFGIGHKHHRTDEQLLATAIKLKRATLCTSMEEVRAMTEKFFEIIIAA
jgi:hypothetical protein